MNRTTIVVVTHNSAGVIAACLDACLRADPAEVVVVDNHSADDTLDVVRRCPTVRLMANQENRGFAAAVNQGVQETAAPSVLLLNPDAELLGGLTDLERACSEPGVGAAAGLLVAEDGEPQRGFSVRRLPTAAALVFETLGLNRLWPSNPVNRRYRCLDLDLSKAQEVEQPAGAFLLFRRDVWQKLGGFDESFYPVWFEDVDFCRRLADAGYRVRFVPSARARHRGGHSFGTVSRQDRVVWWHRSLLNYATRHLRAGPRWLVCGSVLAGAVLRMVTGKFTEMRNGGASRSYGKVILLAWSSLWSSRTGTGMSRVKPTERTDAAESSAQLRKRESRG
jgi:hypothetical protein